MTDRTQSRRPGSTDGRAVVSGLVHVLLTALLLACGDSSRTPAPTGPSDDHAATSDSGDPDASTPAPGPPSTVDDGAANAVEAFGSVVVAYSSNRDGDYDIIISFPDGSQTFNLTRHPAMDVSPSWSPDGSTIAFQSDRSGTARVWLMDYDGANPRPFGDRPGTAYSPSWAPNGREVAFTSDDTGDWEIYSWEVGSNSATNLTNDPAHDWGWSWAPVGRHIAFTSDRDGAPSLYVIDLHDGMPRALGPGSFPAWSPDGSAVVFASVRDGTSDIWLSRPDGSDQRNLTIGRGDDFFPAWSPDGSSIAFMSDRDRPTYFDVMAVRQDGTGLRSLGQTGYLQPFALSWSPDGGDLVFSPFDGNSQVVRILNVASGQILDLSSPPGRSVGAVWSPIP